MSIFTKLTENSNIESIEINGILEACNYFNNKIKHLTDINNIDILANIDQRPSDKVNIMLINSSTNQICKIHTKRSADLYPHNVIDYNKKASIFTDLTQNTCLFNITQAEIKNSNTDFIDFQCESYNTKNITHIIIPTHALLNKLQRIYTTSEYMMHLWITKNNKCIDTHYLNDDEIMKFIETDFLENQERTYTKYINNYQQLINMIS